MKKLFITIIVFSSCTQVTITVPGATTGHTCNLEDCSQTGNTTFKSDCEEGSDCYYFDRLHWEYPKATYEELEKMMWEEAPEPEPEPQPVFRIV